MCLFPFCYLWKAYRYRLSSTGTKSIISMYSECKSRPHNFTWNVGNIRRPAFVTIISVPKEWNSSHRCFISRMAFALARAGVRLDKLDETIKITTIRRSVRRTCGSCCSCWFCCCFRAPLRHSKRARPPGLAANKPSYSCRRFVNKLKTMWLEQKKKKH